MNEVGPVPTIPKTVTTVLVLVPRPPGDWHWTLESLNQEVVPHGVEMPAMLTRLADEDKSVVPKSRPKIVIKAPPLVGAFIGACELTMGAAAARVMRIAHADWQQGRLRRSAPQLVPSKLNEVGPMPTIPPTVNPLLPTPMPSGARQPTLVSLVQKLVPHMAPETMAVTVEWSAPKLSPKIVTEAPPLGGALRGACDVSTGAAAARVTRIAHAHRTRRPAALGRVPS